MLKALLSLFFPRLCKACGNTLPAEPQFVCFSCREELPYCPHLTLASHPSEKAFWGRVEIHAAIGLFEFTQAGVLQKLLHRLKYQGESDIASFLGIELAKAIQKNEKFATVDVLIPVPLHYKKKQQRGYNQSELIAKAICEELNIELNTQLLTRAKATETQTKKGRMERVENLKEAFKLTTTAFPFKHVLLVDDVLTTGATLEACAVLLEKHCKVSIATVAYL